MQKISRYYHTIKPLKLEQILYRLKYRFFPVKKLSVKPSEKLSAKSWPLKTPMVGEQSLFENGEVCFLNKRARIDTPEDWNNSAQHSKLWLYNLHYFDDLNSAGADKRVSLQKQVMRKWITENPPIHGNGWEPYPLSLRLVNWVKWCQRNEDYDAEILRSIEQQADALMSQLEFHILGNHLFANAKALVFVGCVLESARADKYLSKGLELLKREVSEQFLADGGHFELSPMYHCILLWDLIDLYNLGLACGNTQLSHYLDEWKDVIQRGLSWLSIMSHPDGDISFFNDAAFGVAPTLSAIRSYALESEIQVPVTDLKGGQTLVNSGYSRLQVGKAVVLFDHAEIGPSYLPGHAHADNLSFEMSLGTERVFVNSGTSTYEAGTLREYQRSTKAHNTVTLDDESSSEMWGSFRVARRAKPQLVVVSQKDGEVFCHASHDGYKRMVRACDHSRKITLSESKLEIIDEVSSKNERLVAHFHLHPNVRVIGSSENSISLGLSSGAELTLTTTGKISISCSQWFSQFGKSKENTKIEVEFLGGQLETEVRW